MESADTPVRVVHLADLHLGFTGMADLVFQRGEAEEGRPVREVDLERAAAALPGLIGALRPSADVVVIAGDLFHRGNPSPRAITAATGLVLGLLRRGLEVVIVDGNHDCAPARLREGSPLGYLAHLGAEVVCGDRAAIVGSPGRPWRINPGLQDRLLVHAVPFAAVRAGHFEGVMPVPGMINLLLVHGAVRGASLPGRTTVVAESALPPELLRRGWSYVALGDWHAHRYRPLPDAPAYYAGSLEALTFGEAATFPSRPNDPYAPAGLLDVHLYPDGSSELATLPLPARRPVVRLAPLDARGMDARELQAALEARLAATFDPEALLRLEIRDCSRGAWAELDRAALRGLQERVRRCRLEPRWREMDVIGSRDETRPLGEQWQLWLAAQDVPEGDRAWLEREGRARLEEAWQRRATESTAGDGAVDAGTDAEVA